MSRDASLGVAGEASTASKRSTSDAQSLLEKYKEGGESVATVAEVHQKILEMPQPRWSTYEATAQHEYCLSKLRPGESKQNQVAFDEQSVTACMEALKIKEEYPPLQYILAVLYDMLRDDSSNFSIFEQALRSGSSIFDPLLTLFKPGASGGADSDHDWQYIADKSAWILTAVISHVPKFFTDDNVKRILQVLTTRTSCSELGILEAITNILKTETFRTVAFEQDGVQDCIFKVDPAHHPSQWLYKSVFAMWMLSFDASLVKSLKDANIVQKIKAILMVSRTEKVIRLCLTLLKNFLARKADCQEICEDIVEEGLLEAVTQLEYEKWRDTEMYDDIRELIQTISSEVKELSNFDRYMRELETGKLTWGFIHSSKFFGENVMKFESHEFKALKLLASLLNSSDPVTLAVACHDIGEFVSLHPLGKKQVARLGVKERVMELMSSADGDKREVRREALLCCQKIMLNKWQDAASASSK